MTTTATAARVTGTPSRTTTSKPNYLEVGLYAFHDSSVFSISLYEPIQHRLTIMFNNGRVYYYFGVSEEMYADMAAAQSAGKYFNAHIRNDYNCVRVA